MAVAYKGAGDGVTTEASSGNLNPTCPATVDAGDVLIAHVAYEGVATTPSTPADWTLLTADGYVMGADLYKHWIFGKIAVGNEDGAAISFGTPAVTTMRTGRIYSFSGRTSGTIAQCVPTASFVHEYNATDPTFPTVTTTVVDALAVACIFQADDNALVSATGETGGDWTEAVAEYAQAATTPDSQLGLNTCTPTANPGTVTGGTISTANDPVGVIGFQIAPSPVAELPTVTTQAVSAVTGTTATGNGNITSLGYGTVTRRGFCYMSGDSGDPTTANSTAYDDNAGFTTGAYTKSITGLTPLTNYRVRAYIINQVGTAYGSTVQLTANAAPTVTLGTNVVDTATITDTTPAFQFTGTDAGGDEVEYEVQVDTANTFDNTTPIVDSYGIENASNTFAFTTGGSTSNGQSITGNGDKLGSVNFPLSKSAGTTGTFTAHLYAHSGVFGTSSIPTGSPIATSINTIDIAGLSTYPTLTSCDFGFDGTYTLNDGTNYCIVLTATSLSGTAYVWSDTTSTTHSGNRFYYSGSTWLASATFDTVFYVYGGGIPLLDTLSSTDDDANWTGTGSPNPFPSGNEITYTIPVASALSANTYYWRVRATDPLGSNTWGAWSTPTRSFTISAGTATNVVQMIISNA